jgi:hypothetical protein
MGYTFSARRPANRGAACGGTPSEPVGSLPGGPPPTVAEIVAPENLIVVFDALRREGGRRRVWTV